jgi:hypothetical protein
MEAAEHESLRLRLRLVALIPAVASWILRDAVGPTR